MRERLSQVVLHGMFRNPERPADADSGQVAAVHEPVDGHLRDPHERGHLGHGQEPDLRKPFLGLGWKRHLLAPILSPAYPAAAGLALRRAVVRACHQYGIGASVTTMMRSVK